MLLRCLMKLEDQIKQSSFTSEMQKALINIAYTNSYLQSLLNKQFKPYNITIQQFNVLRILKGQHPEPVSINEITARMVDKMSNASRLVEKLKSKGYVNRSTCMFDRRQADVSLTESGVALLNDLNKAHDEQMSDFRHVSEDDYKVLNAILDDFRNGENSDDL